MLLRRNWVAASTLPGYQYVTNVDFWLFSVVKVLLLIYKALESISGTYAIVYGYVATHTVGPGSDPWRAYGINALSYVNRLHEMRFGQGYWISVTRSISWYVEGYSGLGALAVNDAQSLQNIAPPPATYYGPLLAGQGFTPTAGMSVTAWVGGNLCAQGRTMEVGGEVVYSVHVFADGPEATGCGESGRHVTFKVGTQVYAPAAAWNNRRLWELALRPAWCAYLPLVLRH